MRESDHHFFEIRSPWLAICQMHDILVITNNLILPLCVIINVHDYEQFIRSYSNIAQKSYAILFGFSTIIPYIVTQLFYTYMIKHDVFFVLEPIFIVNSFNIIRMAITLYLSAKDKTIKFLLPFKQNCHIQHQPNFIVVILFMMNLIAIMFGFHIIWQSSLYSAPDILSILLILVCLPGLVANTTSIWIMLGINKS